MILTQNCCGKRIIIPRHEGTTNLVNDLDIHQLLRFDSCETVLEQFAINCMDEQTNLPEVIIQFRQALLIGMDDPSTPGS